MATTVVKKYNVAPYYDDFDETKNFHRILFRPGFSVQARELTQLQTALQAQIDRYGQFAFKDGSRVVDGKATLNIQYDFIKVESSFQNGAGTDLNADNYLSDFVGSTITGATNGVTAKVIQAVPYVSDSEPATLYIKYTSSGTGNTTQTFAAGEQLSSDTNTVSGVQRFAMVGGGSNPTNATPAVASSITNPTGQGSSVNIEEGVYFISGTFVFVPAGSIILDKYTNTPNYIVGLKVTEDIVDSAADTSLLDNAQGVPNTAAPGANRYRIQTELVKEPLNIASRTEASYITVLVVEDGKATTDKTDPNLDTELSQRLARRTFEESGNYSVQPYRLNVREHLDDGAGNNGYLTSGNGGNADKLAIGVEPSVAYVKGFRVENTTTKYVEVDKPRDALATRDVNLERITLDVGNFIKLTKSTIKGIPPISIATKQFDKINLHSATGSGGSVIGTARVKFLVEESSTIVRLGIFDIAMSGSNAFSSVASVEWNDGGTAKFRGDLSSTTIFETGANSLVYKLPFNAIKSLFDPGNPSQVNTVYTVRQTFITSTGSNQLAIAQGSFANNTTIHAAIIQNGNYLTAGALDIDCNPTISGGNITFGTVSGVDTTNSSAFTSNDQIIFTADVTKTGVAQKQKTLVSGATVSGTASGTPVSLSLGKADIIKINSIVVQGTSTDVSDRFTLDNGQRDNFYDLGSIVLKPGVSNPGAVTVNFNHYTHGAGDYFTVNSYPTVTIDSETRPDYDNIPAFSSSSGNIALRDVVDFRPRIDDAGANFNSGLGTASQTGIPSPSSLFAADITHYMPRIDKLYVTRKGEFKIEKGVADMDPVAPEVPDDGMGLYDINLSPFVFSLNGVKPKMIDNKRFTMRDIGNIEKRVKNLEYYTSLSLLEQSAADVELYDSSGFSRLKNGFIVDNFTNHLVGDNSNPEYSVAMDKAKGQLRPQFDERNVNLIRKAGDSGNAVKNASIVTMPFTSTNYINQPYASTFSNVNPYNVFSWAGTIDLSPEGDEWKETDVRPVVTIDDSNQFEQFQQMAEETGILGTVWNEWQTNWTGVDSNSDITRVGGRRGTRPGGRGGTFNERIEEEEFFVGGGGQIQTVTTTTTTRNQSREGVQTDLAFDTVTRSNGERVVEVNFVPFIRSRKISFKAQLLKPNTRFYAFFDGTDISNFVREESFAEFSSQSGIDTFEGATAHPSGAGNLVSDASGVIEGSFVIPRNDVLKFATGTREFRLSDNSSNNKDAESSYAEAQYHAQGLLEATEETVVSTKVPRLVTSELRDDRVLVDTTVSETTEWVDPVAETFLVDKAGGIFVNSVEIYFKKKDANIPVRLSIRTTENGIPTQRIVPGADKVLYPGSVNLPSDAAANGGLGNADASTTFSFDHPVYLSQDTEYAIVLTSQSDNYEVYVADMGGFDLTNTTFRIAKQPYNGVFFSSQNASTWTPEQSKDLKFKLNRASFTGSSAEINFTNDILPVAKLRGNALFTSTSDPDRVTVIHPNHGMYGAGSKVTIAGATAFNNLTTTQLNTTHSVVAATIDSYSFDISGATANATGYGGGTNITATENRHIDVLYPLIQNLQVPGTSLRVFASMRSATSVNGTETPHSAISEFELLPNQNFVFEAPRMVGSATTETQNMAGNKSFNLRCVLSTTDEALSPVIDMNRLSLFTIQNRISANNGSEAVANNGPEVSKYITKKIELNEQADIATIYLNALKPFAASIDLFFRTVSGNEDISQVAFTAASPTKIIPTSSTEFSEVRYDIDPAGSFGAIQFKIVLKSTISSQVPILKDFRAICAT